MITGAPHVVGTVFLCDVRARVQQTQLCATLTFLLMVSAVGQIARLKEDEGAVPSAVAEAHRKQLEEIDEVVRKEQQVSPNEV